jgi:hypothetical protein
MSFADLLKTAESGSRGYNSYNRGWTKNAASNKENIDLSKMTLNQIRERQMLPEGHKDRLFAVGLGQVVGSRSQKSDTMGAAMKALNLTGDEYYTPELQNRIITNFLTGSKRPKLNAYITGKSDNLNAAINDAAQEWAALQTTAGIGAYDKNGVNHATVPPNITGQILMKARASYLNAIQSGKKPEEAKAIALGFINSSGINKNSPTTPSVQTASTKPSSVTTGSIAPPPVAKAAVNTAPVTSLTPSSLLPSANALAPVTNPVSPSSPVASDMANAIVPLLSKIAENTTPSIAYNQKNYKPSQDTVLGTM